MHSARPRHPRADRTMCPSHRDRRTPSRHAIGLFRSDEHALASVAVHGWRFEPVDVTYERRTLLIGGPIGFAVSGLVSMSGNRRARRAAECLAAAQWRPLGQLEIIATNDRLLVLHGGAWWSVWYSAIEDARHVGARLELRFSTEAPYLLVGDVTGLARIIEVARSVERGAGMSAAQTEGLPVRDIMATFGEQ